MQKALQKSDLSPPVSRWIYHPLKENLLGDRFQKVRMAPGSGTKSPLPWAGRRDHRARGDRKEGAPVVAISRLTLSITHSLGLGPTEKGHLLLQLTSLRGLGPMSFFPVLMGFRRLNLGP